MEWDEDIASEWGNFYTVPVVVTDPLTYLQTVLTQTVFQTSPSRPWTYVQMTGGAGGTGSYGELIIHSGGTGGGGGAPGQIYIEQTAAVLSGNDEALNTTHVLKVCNVLDHHWILGHDGGIPLIGTRGPTPTAGFQYKSEFDEQIGSLVQFCADGTNPLLRLVLAYKPLDPDTSVPNSNRDAKPADTSHLASFVLLGGSGGLAGGSIQDSSLFLTQPAFGAIGTAGLFGNSWPIFHGVAASTYKSMLQAPSELTLPNSPP